MINIGDAFPSEVKLSWMLERTMALPLYTF